MTSGHILTKVQNMIAGQKSFCDALPGISLRNIRNLFLSYIIIVAKLLRQSAVALKFTSVSPPDNYSEKPFTRTEGKNLGTARKAKKREREQKKRHTEGSEEAFFREWLPHGHNREHSQKSRAQ